MSIPSFVELDKEDRAAATQRVELTEATRHRNVRKLVVENAVGGSVHENGDQGEKHHQEHVKRRVANDPFGVPVAMIAVASTSAHGEIDWREGGREVGYVEGVSLQPSTLAWGIRCD